MAFNLKNIVKKKQPGETTDWVGYAIVIAVVLIGGFFITSELGFFILEQEYQEAQVRKASNHSLYKKNLQDPQNTPHAVYEEAREALLNNDLEGVLDTIHPSAISKYEDGLREAAAEGRLPEAAERMMPLAEKVYDDDLGTVVHETEPIPGNDSPNPLERYTQEVEFMTNNKGIWKISSI